ncbi:MAG: hypothetical protein JOZ22_07445 [Acidobacteriia bacterium]|nr:hypothetical protein [Terriglobia bacterium]
MPYYPTRKLTVLALDPSVRDRGKLLRAQIEIPNESLSAGPRGYRVHVIDYDATSGSYRAPARMPAGINSDSAPPRDPFETASDSELLSSRSFHAFMAYGVVMKTLARFEFALGRRIAWSFGGHQIQVAPHAFEDANAFYSIETHGLHFGYFGAQPVYSCLSHEIVSHETTHALLDGLRERYLDPSSPQQAGFHEGFADIVALLSILSAESVVARVVDLGTGTPGSETLRRAHITPQRLRSSGLFGLAEEMGSELAGIHGHALRRSIALEPRRDYLKSGEYNEPHDCGEVLVAAVLNAYLEVWVRRLEAIGDRVKLDRKRAAEEGAEIAERLLTMCIRAIDYCPPTDLQFGDFASAVLTADWELNPRDEKYRIRHALVESFEAYGIEPSSAGVGVRQKGSWDPPPEDTPFRYDSTHFDSMKSALDELFRFLWENRAAFKLNEQAYTRVLSVRPCVRVGHDGFTLRETVAEYHQRLTLFARELGTYGIEKPAGMPDDTEVPIYGGNAVIFDEYGRVKYNIGKSIPNLSDPEVQERQSARLAYLWEQGFFGPGASKLRAFSRIHARRSMAWYRSVGAAK